jgi:hypothetical protein
MAGLLLARWSPARSNSARNRDKGSPTPPRVAERRGVAGGLLPEGRVIDLPTRRRGRGTNDRQEDRLFERSSARQTKTEEGGTDHPAVPPQSILTVRGPDYARRTALSSTVSPFCESRRSPDSSRSSILRHHSPSLPYVRLNEFN